VSEMSVYLSGFENLTYNGPAVGFSKRYPTTAPPQICPGRPESCHGASLPAGRQGGGACPAIAKRKRGRGFCHPGTRFGEYWRDRGTMQIYETELSKCNKCYKKALAQCRCTSYLGARKLSRCRNLIASRCGYPGTRFSRIYLRSRILQKP